MEAKALNPTTDAVMVRKEDLVEAWSLLLRMVISLRKIGSCYAVSHGQTEQTPEQRQNMIEAIAEFMSPELWHELSHVRVALETYLPDDEAEAIADRLSYWQPASQQK
jgi:hypothetical protein